MAEKNRRIMVAVDEGEESMHALSWCLHNLLLPNSNDTIILLHCHPPRPVFPALDGTGSPLSFNKYISTQIIFVLAIFLYYCFC